MSILKGKMRLYLLLLSSVFDIPGCQLTVRAKIKILVSKQSPCPCFPSPILTVPEFSKNKGGQPPQGELMHVIPFRLVCRKASVAYLATPLYLDLPLEKPPLLLRTRTTLS